MFYRVSILIPALCAAALAWDNTPLDQGFRHMYNLEFVQAHETFHEWQRAYPSDPMGPVSDAAAYLFAEFDRLHILQSEFFTHDQHFITDHRLAPDPGLKRDFQAALQAARTLSTQAPSDRNGQFAGILCDGLESDYLALIEKRYAAAFRAMKSARMRAEQLVAADPSFYDAWLAVGVENYMLSIKPAPVRWLLRLGGGRADRSLGIEKLRLTAERGHYLAPFAKLMLAVAALRDRDTTRARALLEGLTKDYPRNRLYAEELSRLDGRAARPSALRPNALRNGSR